MYYVYSQTEEKTYFGSKHVTETLRRLGCASEYPDIRSTNVQNLNQTQPEAVTHELGKKQVRLNFPCHVRQVFPLALDSVLEQVPFSLCLAEEKTTHRWAKVGALTRAWHW